MGRAGRRGRADRWCRAPTLIEVAPFAAKARAAYPAETLAAIALARANVARFHQATLPRDMSVETMPGLIVAKQWRAIDRVGLYVPGGNAPLFSTLLMLAIPAQVAGVSEIVIVTPPRGDGGLDPAIALAAELCGIEAIWTVGGAQAIAALAFGASDIAPVSLIAGPGNAWVAAAKAMVSSLPWRTGDRPPRRTERINGHRRRHRQPGDRRCRPAQPGRT